MGKRLNTFVHVRDKDGANTVFGPDDDVPAWAVAEIRNDAVWDDGTSKDDTDDGVPEALDDDGEAVAPRRGRGRPPKQPSE